MTGKKTSVEPGFEFLEGVFETESETEAPVAADSLVVDRQCSKETNVESTGVDNEEESQTVAAASGSPGPSPENAELQQASQTNFVLKSISEEKNSISNSAASNDLQPPSSKLQGIADMKDLDQEKVKKALIVPIEDSQKIEKQFSISNSPTSSTRDAEKGTAFRLSDDIGGLDDEGKSTLASPTEDSHNSKPGGAKKQPVGEPSADMRVHVDTEENTFDASNGSPHKPRSPISEIAPIVRTNAILDNLTSEDDEEIKIRRVRRRREGSLSKSRDVRSKDGSRKRPSSSKSRLSKKNKRHRLQRNDSGDSSAERDDEDGALMDEHVVKAATSDEDEVVRTQGGLDIGVDIEDHGAKALDLQKDLPKKPKNPFQEAIEKGKALRAPRRKQLDPAKVEQECIEFLEKMVCARDKDVNCFNSNQPALHKLRMLPEVEKMTTKVAHLEVLVDNMLLAVLKTWLDPMSDGTLPNVQVRTTLLNILANIHVDSDWVEKLKGSQGLGRVVHFLSRHDDFIPNRRAAERLVAKWARPVYQSESDFRGILNEFDRPDEGVRASSRGIVSSRQAAQETVKHFKTTREKLDEFRSREDEREDVVAQVPRPSALLYTALPNGARPTPSAKVVRALKHERRTAARVNRTLSNMRRMNKGRSARASKPSVNGR